MTSRRNGSKWNWRAELDAAETAEVQWLEAEAAVIDAWRRRVTANLNLIRNRGVHRAKAAARRTPAERPG